MPGSNQVLTGSLAIHRTFWAGDEPGKAAAQDCARRWKREGRRVRIARPPMGMDFMPFRSGSRSTYPGSGKGPASVKATASAADGLADGDDLPWR